jgi:hypothetical protein
MLAVLHRQSPAIDCYGRFEVDTCPFRELHNCSERRRLYGDQNPSSVQCHFLFISKAASNIGPSDSRQEAWIKWTLDDAPAQTSCKARQEGQATLKPCILEWVATRKKSGITISFLAGLYGKRLPSKRLRFGCFTCLRLPVTFDAVPSLVG